MEESWVFRKWGKCGKWGWVLCCGGAMVVEKVARHGGNGYGVGNDGVCGL
jgi:hypothetical protein